MSDCFHRIRSQPLGGRPVADLVKGLRRRLGRTCHFRRHEPSVLDVFNLFRDPLDTLGAFESTSSVLLSRPVGPGLADLAPYLEAIRRHGPGRSRMTVTLSGAETDGGGRCSFCLHFGWQMEQFGDNFPYCGVAVQEGSPGWDDLDRRRELFAEILDLLGLGDVVRAELDGGKLRVVAATGCKVTPTFAHLDGTDPRGIGFAGFPDIDAAVAAAERIVERAFRRVDDANFAVFVGQKDDYEEIRPALDALAGGWMVSVGGALTDASAAVLAGKPGPGAPARVPAFLWEQRGGRAWHAPWFTYSGELVASAGGYCLELATDRPDPAHLLACGRFFPGLEFQPVSPDEPT